MRGDTRTMSGSHTKTLQDNQASTRVPQAWNSRPASKHGQAMRAQIQREEGKGKSEEMNGE